MKYQPHITEYTLHREKARQARISRDLRILDAQNVKVIPPAFPEFYPEKPKKSVGLRNFFHSSVVLLKKIRM